MRSCTQQKITEPLTNIFDVRLLSISCPIGRRMFLCTICALEHLCTNRRTNSCAQTVDKYSGRQFADRLCTNGRRIFRTSICAQTVDRYIGTKRKRKFNENQENNILGECKQLSQEKSQTLVRYVGQRTDSKRLSAV